MASVHILAGQRIGYSMYTTRATLFRFLFLQDGRVQCEGNMVYKWRKAEPRMPIMVPERAETCHHGQDVRPLFDPWESRGRCSIKCNYDDQGIYYPPYCTGDPIKEVLAVRAGKMYLK